MRVRSSTILISLVAAAAPGLHAECTAQSAADGPRLVELYTSEGCSSCPPAEKWLNSLHDDASRIALEFHVDYWDELGWRDQFADARYSARQRELAGRGDQATVYTPQVFIDGHVWKDWPRAPTHETAVVGSPDVSLTVSRGDDLQVRVDGAATDASRYRTFVALTENGLTSSVKAGENRGRQLAHDHVVRDFAGPLAMPRAEAVLHPPRELDMARSSVVAFVEDARSGDIVRTVRLPLAQCPP
jgi:hypothetical protein